jgi:hypothetical protein
MENWCKWVVISTFMVGSKIRKKYFIFTVLCHMALLQRKEEENGAARFT